MGGEREEAAAIRRGVGGTEGRGEGERERGTGGESKFIFLIFFCS